MIEAIALTVASIVAKQAVATVAKEAIGSVISRRNRDSKAVDVSEETSIDDILAQMDRILVH